MKITMVVIKLLFLGALFIVSNYNLYLSNPIDRENFFNMYSSWLDHLFSQALDVTGYVVKFEWLPDINQTYSER